MSVISWVHGWSMNKNIWRSFTQRFPEHQHHCLNLPGHGGADLQDADLKAWAESLLAQQPTPSIWVGWSLGGLVSLYLAHHYPEHVKGLILIAASPRFTEAEDWPCGVKGTIFEQFSNALSTNPSITLERFVTLQMLGAKHAKSTIHTLKTELTESPAQLTALQDGLALLAHSDCRFEFSETQQPMQLILGEKDTLISAKTTQPVQALKPSIHIEHIDGAGHVPF
ncbi:MAG: alpha/beta fold hydrolase, partial [Methylococcales bacterium]|nr:alpha/beta fold hydrolase [Methylococcales bacterium]